MQIELQPLPYTPDALAPHLSAASLSLHHTHHYRTYVDRTNELIRTSGLQATSLANVVRKAARCGDQPLLHAASEAWNHAFYFKSMSPAGGGKPTGRIGQLIDARLGGYDGLAEAVLDAAFDLSGSGWLWLSLDHGVLDVRTTLNSDTPIIHGQTPLLGIDLWEHAYHHDHQSRRGEYVTRFLAGLANWDFANANLERALSVRCAAQ